MVTSVSSGWDWTTGGKSLTLGGCGFTGTTAVIFGFTPAPSFTVINDTTLTAIDPPSTFIGPVALSVVTPRGTSPGMGKFIYYNPGSPSPCTAATLTPSLASPQIGGTTVRFTPAASGCPNPEFRIDLRSATSSQWTEVQGYAPTWAAPWWNWSTFGKGGKYFLRVWAEDVIPTTVEPDGYAGFEAQAVIEYVVTPATCSAASLQAAPDPPKPSGTKVTLTARASGCHNYPLFEFWMRPASASSWTLLQRYERAATSELGPATYTWNTSGLGGTYSVMVWVKDAGGVTPDFDASATLTYEVIGSCAGVKLSASPSSPQTGGTPVTITAAATGCPSPLYEFWIQTSNSTNPTMVQTYSTQTTYSWDTTGLSGEYTIVVWVRDSSSSASSYDKTASVVYSLVPATSPSASPSTTVAPPESPTPPPASSARGGSGPRNLITWLTQSVTTGIAATGGAVLFLVLAVGAGLWLRHRASGGQGRADTPIPAARP